MDNTATPCPDENALLAMMDGLLDEKSREEIEAHMDQCPACAELMIALGHLGPPVDPTQLSLESTAELPAVARPTRPRLGRYILGQLLGMGGMGAVYEGFDPSLRRRVAIKILRPDLNTDNDQGPQRARHKREARALALLAHPNVLTVFDTGEEEDGRIWFAMALVDGQNIPDWIALASPDWRQIVAVYLDIARGLEAAHDAGVLHRDIKPQNMMVQRDGRAVLVDFGLAHASNPALLNSTWVGRAPELTSTGIVVGTPYYMAPEQLSGQHIDARADQFSWCVSLYESLYGARPFIASSLEALLSQMQSAPLARPRGDQIPAPIFDVLVKGLSPRPAERYADMGELISALERALQARASKPPREQRTSRLGLGALLGVILAVASLAGVASIHFFNGVTSDPQPARSAHIAAKPSPKAAPVVAPSLPVLEPAISASAQALARAITSAAKSSSLEAQHPEPPAAKPAPSKSKPPRAGRSSKPGSLSVGFAAPQKGASAPAIIATPVVTPPGSPVQHGPDFSEADRALAKSLYQNLNARWVMACTSSFATCRGAMNEFNRAVRPHGGAVATLVYLRDKGANPNSLKLTTSVLSAFLYNAYERAAEAQECALALELFIEFLRVHADIIVPKSDFHHKRSRDRAGMAKLLTSKFPDCAGTL